MKNNVKKKRIIKVLLILISVVCLVLIYNYLNKNIGFEIPCIFHKFTGLYCPGCGITRMIFSIFELNFYQAFRYNPLIFIFFPFLILYCIYEIVIYINNKKDT